jgi:hypothetical protein
MRRVLQIVALVVAVILTVQPVLASPSCMWQVHAGNGAANTCCCIHVANAAIREAGSGCDNAMLPSAASPGCNRSECGLVSSRPIPQMALPAKSNVNGIVLFIPIEQFSVVSISEPSEWPFRTPEAPGPARYLLFQVFRI